MDIKRSWGNVFHQVQSEDPFDFLTCSAVDDITVPEGDVTLKYEPNPMKSGKFRVSSQIIGEPGAPTMSIVRPLKSVWNYLMETDCPAQYRVNWACGGDRTVKTNYDVAFLNFYARITNRNIATPTALEPDDEERVETNADLSGIAATMLYKLNGSSQSNSFLQAINDMAFLPEACEGVCGDKVGAGDLGYAVMDIAGYLDYSTAEVGFTEDGGATWSGVSGEPFAPLGDHLLSVILVDTGGGDHRVIVGRDGIAGRVPGVSYSDDEGDTWTEVLLTGGPHDAAVNALARDNTGALWAACGGGYLFKSTDMGATWTVKEDGTETSEDLLDIVFVKTAMFGDDQVGYAVGENNTFLYTEDGGDDWAAGTGPTGGIHLVSVALNRFGHVFVGGNDAILYRTTEGVDTEAADWDTPLDLSTTGGSIDSIDFDMDMQFIGNLAHNDTNNDGVVYRSEDGGASWYATPLMGATPSNNGINVVRTVDPNIVYAGGEVVSTNPYIAKFTRRS